MAGTLTTVLNLNGYTDLPPGKIAAVVTYLEMREPLRRRAVRRDAWTLGRITDDLARYRALFRRVGEPWLWFSRTVMPDEALAAIIGDPKVVAYALRNGTGDIGLLELDFRRPGECEITFFGLTPEVIGTGAGRFLMTHGVRRAFATPIQRLFVHTCSLDHPSALGFYLRSGFVPYKRAIEVADDPRLTGRLPVEAAPHIPLLRVPAAAGRVRSRRVARLDQPGFRRSRAGISSRSE